MEARPRSGREVEGKRRFHSETELRGFAASLGRLLRGGEVLGLVGALGAGKTVFTKGLAEGLEVPPSIPVTSPTFVLHRRYPGRLTLEHLDAYRLRSPVELEALGLADLLEGPVVGGSRGAGPAVVVVEWADKVVSLLPPRTIWIELDIIDPTTRDLTCTIPNPDLTGMDLVRSLQALLSDAPLSGT